jgi:hypothetical protein
VAIVRADFNGIDAQHSIHVRGRVGLTRPVAMIGEHDELQSRATCRRRDGRLIAKSIRSCRVNVHGATDGSAQKRRARARYLDWFWRKGSDDNKNADRGQNDRDRPGLAAHGGPRYRASALSALALSVRSQVNSGSLRPKWPNAAVFL